MKNSVRVLRGGMAAATVLGLACWGARPAPARPGGRPGRPVTIVISPSGATLAPGQTVQLSASARDRAGNPVPGVSVAWSSSNTGVLRITNTGSVTAAAAGTAFVTATGGGKVGRI